MNSVAALKNNHGEFIRVIESELGTPSQLQERCSFLNGGSGLFKLALYFKQAGTILPFLDIPLKRLDAASTQRNWVGLQEEGTKGEAVKE